MLEKRVIYADANIYLNLFFEEQGSKYVSFYEQAVLFFNRVMDGELVLAYSDHVVREVKKKLMSRGKHPGIMDEFLACFEKKGLLVKAEQTRNDVKRAKELAPNHYEDSMHILLAVKIGVAAFVTRDDKGFPEECVAMIYVCKPEGLP